MTNFLFLLLLWFHIHTYARKEESKSIYNGRYHWIEKERSEIATAPL